MKYELVCPGCRGKFYDTTDQFDPRIAPHPKMFKMKSCFVSWGWDQFPDDATAGFGVMECPECGAAYAPSGRVIVTPEPDLADFEDEANPIEEFVCVECGKAYRHESSLKRHMKEAHGD